MSLTPDPTQPARALPTAAANAIRRANRPPLGDPPVDIASNLAPASIEVSSNLAEDTVIAGVMDIAEGDNTLAMFANPFSGGSEEMLYIDEQNTLRWARHVNPVDDVDPGGLSGWSTDEVALHIGEVVVAVTPDGTLWAVTTSVGRGSRGEIFRLVADPAVPDGQRWRSVQTVDFPVVSRETCHILPVYYCNDRPATPVVFFDFTDNYSIYWLMANHTLGDGTPPAEPWRVNNFGYFPSLRDATKVAGIDSPNTEFSQGPLVETIKLWSHLGTKLTLTVYDARTKVQNNTGLYGDYVRIIAPWTHLNGAGVFVQNRLDPAFVEAIFETELMREKYLPTLAYLDSPLDDLSVWQDAEGLAHIYGRDSDGTLKVVHQTGWINAPYDQAPPDVLLVPSWDEHLITRPDGYDEPRCTTRPLVASVARYDVDAYPDDMPSQHVMHQGAEPGETCAIYSQDLRTQLWHQERMRLVPEALPKPYIVPRYEATLTVRNALGTPVANCAVSLSAEAPVDLEVDGRFYRTGTITPVQLVTNAHGQVTLRVVARSLLVPQIHVTAPGLAQSVSVQMASDVHKFLSGRGTLPNHPDGFNADVVESATKPDGTPLFAGIKKAADPGDWPPSAQDVVTWCQGVFAVDSGAPLPPQLREGLADDEDVVAFSFQTRDPSRPGLEVFTSREQLDAHHERLREQGILDDFVDWVGDLWQGIQDGVVDLGAAVVNLWDETVELIVTFADEVEAVFICAWQDIVSAVHAIEAVFVAIEAKVEEVIDWLKWAFNFADALKTAKVLRDGLDEVPRLVGSLLTEIGTVADDFFIEKEAEVRASFDTMKAALQGQSLSSLQGPTAAVPSDSQPDPQVSSAGDQVQSPHTQWFVQQVTQLGSSASAASVEATPRAGGPVDDLVEEIFTLIGDLPILETLSTAMTDLGAVFTELFSGKDPASMAASQLVDILDFAEDIVVGILQLLDHLANDILRWSGDALGLLSTVLDARLDDFPLLSLIWDFVVDESGLDPADYPLTVGMFGAFFAAFPFTVITKAITGEAPFAGGGIPVPPALGEEGWQSPYPTEAWMHFQAFQGFAQTIDLFLDGWLDANALSRGANPIPQPVVIGFTIMHLIAYVLGDWPWFWGYASFTENKLPYFRYILTVFFNVYDLFIAFENGTIAEMFEGQRKGVPLPPELVEKRQTILMLATTAFGWIRIGINLAEYERIPNRNDGDPANWYDYWNLLINLTAYIQTATGFVRFVLARSDPFSPTYFLPEGAVVVKMFIDVLGDIFSGVSTMIQPYQELHSPPSIDLPEGDFVLGAAQMWQPYESAAVPASGGWPSYSWSLWWGNPDNGHAFDLPPGLTLTTPYFDADLGRIAQIVGTPTGGTLGKTQVHLRVEDGYGPTFTADQSCVFELLAAPAGIPTAGFTASPETAQAPATISFTDISTGSPTGWRWALDNDGDEVTEQNPVVEYTVADTYTLTLVAINDQGYSAPVTQQLVITAPTGAPVADFTFTDNPRSGASIQFTNETTGGPTTYVWKFGDGRVSSKRNPLITFDRGGDYVVSLLCANANGWGVRKRHLVSVQWS